MSLSINLLALLLLAFDPAKAPLARPPQTATEDLRALIAEAGSTSDHGGADLVQVLDHTRVGVEPSGLAHYRQRRVIKVLTEPGATKLASVRFDYDPASNLINITRARIHHRAEPDGEVPSPTDLSTAGVRDLPQPQHWIYWGPRMKVLPVPRLAVGEALEIETYKKGFIIAYLGGPGGGGGPHSDEEKFIPPMRGHFYDVVLFGHTEMPTLEQRYEVTLPRDKPLRFEVYNGEVYSALDHQEQGLTYAFWKTKLPAHAHEARAADASDYLPKVVMATLPDWATKSRWFAEVNEAQFEANDAIRAKVQEITRGARSEEEKIDAILHWTAQEIRYSGITMGEGEGYTLHSGAMTFNDRAGVCKDIAGMSITMLRAAGLTSYPAMTMAGSRVERVPADQFNHCVVAVERPDGYRMIDPTWAPFSAELWSSAEREQHYLIGTPRGETLMKTPYLPPEHNRLTIQAHSRIEMSGDLSSEVRIRAHGYPEDRLRRQIAYRSTAELSPSFAEMLARVGATATLEDLRFSDHRDLKRPFEVDLHYRVAGYALVGEGVVRSAVPSSAHLLGGASFADWLEATEPESRTSAIWLRSPQLVRFEEEIELPEGFSLVGPGLDEEIRTSQGHLRATLRQAKGRLVFEEEIRIAQRNIPPGAYPDLKKIVDAVRELKGRRFYLVRKGGAS